MSRRKIHRNSREAYAEGRLELFPKRSRAIIGVLERYKVALTDRAIMLALGFEDPNAVRPRITEMVEAGVLREVSSQRDPETGKTVRLVELAVKGAQIPLL